MTRCALTKDCTYAKPFEIKLFLHITVFNKKRLYNSMTNVRN